MENVLLEVRDCKKYFGGVKALDGVSLTICKGEIRCLAGENGCGKSTLIKILSGAYKKDEGSIFFESKHIETLTPREAMNLGIQVVYQDVSLFPNLSVSENILCSDQLDKKKIFVHWKKLHAMAKVALQTIKVDIDPQKHIYELTLAQRQLVAIAKALYHEAKLIILDEPTTSLTNKEIDILFRVLATLQKKGVAILLVTHKLREVLSISQTLTIMRNGKVIIEGETSKFTEKSISFHMTGREIHERIQAKTVEKHVPPVCVISHLSKSQAFSDISFSVWPGEILGITGLLGSGRSEVAKAIVGLDTIDNGSIIIHGKKVRHNTIGDAIENRIGYVPEDRLTEGLFYDQSIQHNMIATSMRLFLKNKLGIVDQEKLNFEVDQFIKEFNIKMKDKKSDIKSLSGGNAQKVVLARWLMAHVDVLFLNGPTVGVDIGAKFEIYSKLQELSNAGIALVIISDDVPELVQNCHRLLVMHKGSIVNELGEGSVTEEAIYSVLGALS